MPVILGLVDLGHGILLCLGMDLTLQGLGLAGLCAKHCREQHRCASVYLDGGGGDDRHQGGTCRLNRGLRGDGGGLCGDGGSHRDDRCGLRGGEGGHHGGEGGHRGGDGGHHGGVGGGGTGRFGGVHVLILFSVWRDLADGWEGSDHPYQDY
jgi:hypothetical protein